MQTQANSGLNTLRWPIYIFNLVDITKLTQVLSAFPQSCAEFNFAGKLAIVAHADAIMT